MSLKESGQRTTAGTARARVRSGLVMAEVALAVVLVIGAGLLLRSFWNLMTVDAGFNRSRLVTFGVVLPAATYRTPQSSVRLLLAAHARVARSDAGVQSVAAMTGLPPSGRSTRTTRISRATRRRRTGRSRTWTITRRVTHRLPHDDGHSDRGGAGLHAVRRYRRPGGARQRDPCESRSTRTRARSAGGRRWFGPQTPWLTIVGVVRDVKQGGVNEKTGYRAVLAGRPGADGR